MSKSLPLFGLRAAVAVARSGGAQPSPGRLRFLSRLYAIYAVIAAPIAIAEMLLARNFMTRVSGGLILTQAVIFAVCAAHCRNLARRADTARRAPSQS